MISFNYSFYLFTIIFYSSCFIIPIKGICIRNNTLPYRLPQSVIPESYFLKFEPDFDSLTLIGGVLINVNVIQPTSCILLNSRQIKITGL